MKQLKKPRQIKKEDIKQEIPRVQLPVTAREPIVIDDSDEDDSIYVPKARTANSTTFSAAIISNNGGKLPTVVMLYTSRLETSVSCDTVVSLTCLTLFSGW